MKLMKKVLLAGMAASILLVSCGQGNGGHPSGNGSGGSTDSIPEVVYKEPILPAPSGTDPFEGKANVKVYSYDNITPDTTNKIISVKDAGTEVAKLKYTYDAEGTITLYTTHVTWPTKQADGTWKDTLVTAKEAVDSWDNAVRNKMLKEVMDSATSTDAIIHVFANNFGVTLTAADLATENLESTLDKLMTSPAIAQRKASMTQSLSATTSCLLQTSGTETQLTYTGLYDSSQALNAQTGGYFYGSEFTIDFDVGHEYIRIGDKRYNMTSVADGVITCTEKSTGATKTFPYTTEGSGNNTKVIVDLDGIKITCGWIIDGGNYDPSQALNAQTGGYFYGCFTIDFDVGYEYIEIGDKTYNMTSVADGVITCTEKSTGATKTFPYTTEGSGNDTKVIVDLDGIKITCGWNSWNGDMYYTFNYKDYYYIGSQSV